MCDIMNGAMESLEVISNQKKRMYWGATCKYSKGNRQLSCSPIPLAPHLSRDWVSWNASDESGEEEEEETIHTLDKYHRKIFLGKIIPKTGLMPKRSESYCSSLNIRSLSVGSRNHCSPKSSEEETFEPEYSPSHGFKTIFRTKRAAKPVQYQWVPSQTPKQTPKNRQDDKEVSPFLSVNAGSSSNLSTYRPNTAQSARSNNPAVLSSPHTSPAHLRPRTSQHRPASGGFGGGGAIKANHAHHIDFHKSNAHRTGRAGLKDFSSAKTANGKCQRDDLSSCVKMERMVAVTRCSTSSGRIGVPEPPAPSPLIPH